MRQGYPAKQSRHFSSPIILICKKNGEWQLCVDYWSLNEITIKDAYSIATIDEIFNELHGAQFFSKINLKSGFHQIWLMEDAIPMTIFHTHDNHYEFHVMPFGLCNAPSTF